EAKAVVPAAEGLDPVWAAHFRLMEAYVGVSAEKVSEPVRPEVRKTAVVSVPVDSRMNANFAGMNLEEERDLSSAQREFLGELISRYTAKTGRSKKQTQAVRKDLADWKHSLQFKRTLKEL